MRFTLRGLLILVGIFAAGSAALGTYVRQSLRDRQQLVDLARETRATLYCDSEKFEYGHYQPLLNDLTPLSTLRAPRITGVKFDFFYRKATDADIANVCRFRSLETVDAGNSPLITDQSCRELANMTQLACLILDDTSITDEGLKRFEALTNLEGLTLSNTKVTDRGLAHLKNLTKLRRLNLFGTKITDASVEVLCRFTKLEILLLDETQVSDAGALRIQRALEDGNVSANGKEFCRLAAENKNVDTPSDPNEPTASVHR